MPSRKPDQKDWMYLSWQAGIFASFCQVYWAKLSCLAAAHGLRAHDDHFPKANRKSCKIYEILSFCRKNDFVMQNHRLGIPNWADSTTKNTLKYLTNVGRSAQSAKIFGIFVKKLSLGVRSPCCCLRSQFCWSDQVS